MPEVATRADLVFGPARVAVYVDGCFWHSCPVHGTEPKANAAFWRGKLTRNRERDAQTDIELRRRGWEVIRVWEHERAVDAADRVERIVRARQLSDQK